jgi:hypothetical protein
MAIALAPTSFRDPASDLDEAIRLATSGSGWNPALVESRRTARGMPGLAPGAPASAIWRIDAIHPRGDIFRMLFGSPVEGLTCESAATICVCRSASAEVGVRARGATVIPWSRPPISRRLRRLRLCRLELSSLEIAHDSGVSPPSPGVCPPEVGLPRSRGRRQIPPGIRGVASISVARALWLRAPIPRVPRGPERPWPGEG